MKEFSFDINVKNSKAAYEMVQRKFKLHAAPKLKTKMIITMEDPPKSFSFETTWATGSIVLTSGSQGTHVAGIIERKWERTYPVIIIVACLLFLLIFMGKSVNRSLIVLWELMLLGFQGGLILIIMWIHSAPYELSESSCKAIRSKNFQIK